MKTVISIEIDTDRLTAVNDQYLAQLWHVTQANPAPMEDRAAGKVAELVGREIIRRFLASTPPDLWSHQGGHADFCRLLDLKRIGIRSDQNQAPDEGSGEGAQVPA